MKLNGIRVGRKHREEAAEVNGFDCSEEIVQTCSQFWVGFHHRLM